MPVFALDLTAKLILGAVAAVFLGFAVWWIFIHPGEQHAALVKAKVSTEAVQATLDTSKAANTLVEHNTETFHTIDHLTETNHETIVAAPGANDAVNPALVDAALHALCMRDVYHGTAACPGL